MSTEQTDLNLTPPESGVKTGEPQKRNWGRILFGVLIAALVVGLIVVGVWAASTEGLDQKNPDHYLRQKSNPFSWSTTEHEAQTYKYPKNISVFQPSRGALSQYMMTRNPIFD